MLKSKSSPYIFNGLFHVTPAKKNNIIRCLNAVNCTYNCEMCPPMRHVSRELSMGKGIEALREENNGETTRTEEHERHGYCIKVADSRVNDTVQ
jgi:hypothetical protein